MLSMSSRVARVLPSDSARLCKPASACNLRSCRAGTKLAGRRAGGATCSWPDMRKLADCLQGVCLG